MSKMQLNDLYILLQNSGIDTDLYSVGNAKTVEQLHEEILSGETNIINDDKQLIREVETLFLIIKGYDSKILREKWVKYGNKPKVPRLSPLAEKMMLGESDNIPKVILRAINEKLSLLKIKLNINIQLNTMKKCIYDKNSDSYPGLKTKYIVYIIQVKIDNLPNTKFKTREYLKNKSTEIRLTTAWEWVEPKSENYSFAPVKNYLDNYF